MANSRNGRRQQRKRGRGPQARSRADRQLAQGTGRTVSRPFNFGPRSLTLRAWDAFDPAHAPLPRSTGPYAVVRTSNLFSSNAKFLQFGTFQRLNASDVGSWSNCCCVEGIRPGDAINSAFNVRLRSVPIPGNSLAGTGLTCVPSAISVQIMNPNALQTTSGIIAGGVAHTQLDLNGRAETFNDVSTEFISFFRPRLMSAGKLALRGVQMNSYPLNMAAIADFQPISPTPDGTVATYDGSALAPVGWAPMVVINQGTEALQFLVTVEWRVRFDLGNPAVASHMHYGVTPDRSWDGMIRSAVSLGNGVMDIVERVASAGQAVQQVAALANRARPLMIAG